MNATNLMLKSTFSGLQRCRWQYGSIFIRLGVVALKSAKYRGILRKFERIAIQGHPRLSIFNSLCQSKAHMHYATSY